MAKIQQHRGWRRQRHHITRVLVRGVLFSSVMVWGWQCSSDNASQGQASVVDHTNSKYAALERFDSCEALTQHLRASMSEQLRIELSHFGGNYGYPSDDAGIEHPTAPGEMPPGSSSSGPSTATPTAGGTASGGSSGGGSAGGDSHGGSAGAAEDARHDGVDFSGTNNQEAGVDEADIVKTDGRYIYLFDNGQMRILDVPTAGGLAPLSKLSLEGWPQSVLLSGNYVVIFSSVNFGQMGVSDQLRPYVTNVLPGDGGVWYSSPSMTKITVVDVTNHATPRVKRELYMEGDYNTARLAAGSVYMVASAWMNTPQGLRTWVEFPDEYYQRLEHGDRDGAETIRRALLAQAMEYNAIHISTIPLDDLVPALYEKTVSGGTSQIVRHPFTDADCANFLAASDGLARSVTSLLSLRLFDTALSFEADHIVGNGGIVYASQNQLVIAEQAQQQWWYGEHTDLDYATNLHRFDISNSNHTTYTGSGRIAGTVHDQFAISESHGALRVAATTGNRSVGWRNGSLPDRSNHVYVLAGESTLEVVGHVDGIAPGEQIWSSRFVGDRAYVVTFRNTDPLWVIDVSNNTQPVVLGELEVPGVSTYIHPVGDHYLLTIGFGGTESGLDWNTQVSLFDVQDFAHPRLADNLSLSAPAGNGWQYAWSEATYEHKAFQFWAPLSMLAVPISTYRSYPVNGDSSPDPNDGGAGSAQPPSTGMGSNNAVPAHAARFDARDEPPQGGGSGGEAQPPQYYVYEYVSLLQLVNVDQQRGKLSLYGHVDHAPFYNNDQSRYWASNDIHRSIFMHDSAGNTGDYIYAISDRGVTVNKIAEGLPLITSVPLEGTGPWQYPDYPAPL